MSPQYWQALGAIIVACGALYSVVTLPLLRVIKAEGGGVRAEIALTEARVKLLLTEVEARLTAHITAVDTGLKVEITAAEKRLNERIDTRLVHR